MKAVICESHGDPELLVFCELPNPVAEAGEVVIDVAAAGVNFPDTLTIRNLYQFKPELPFSPGAEAAGVISQVGSGVTHLAVGDRVIAMLEASGGFAEQAAANGHMCIPVPDQMPLDLAAAFVFVYSTSYHEIVNRGDPKAGETMLVLGAAGGVGRAAVEIGVALGLRVIAAASTEAKLQACRNAGAVETINYVNEDLRSRMRDLGGADIVYDPVGGDYAEPAVRSLNWLGRYLVVGFAAGQIPRIPLNLALLKGCDIRGIFWGSFIARNPDQHQANMDQLARWFEDGTVKPLISKRYSLEDAPKALRDMMNRKAIGKLLIEIDRELF
jgi:NADPH2:quinone reductase